MRQIREILRLKYEGGLGHRAIALACDVGVGTVSEYVGRVLRAGLAWPLPSSMDEAALEAVLFPAPMAGRDRVAPDLAGVHQELKRVGVTLHLLWEVPSGLPRRVRLQPVLRSLPTVGGEAQALDAAAAPGG
jgi:hypothetical protein